MRTREYNAYMAKRQLIMEKFNFLNIEIVILEYLGNMGIDITNTNISHLVDMIKKVLFNYSMIGRDETLKVMRDNQNYLFDSYDNDFVSNLKSEIQLLLGSRNKQEGINYFVISTADEINHNINKLQRQNIMKYALK